MKLWLGFAASIWEEGKWTQEWLGQVALGMSVMGTGQCVHGNLFTILLNFVYV